MCIIINYPLCKEVKYNFPKLTLFSSALPTTTILLSLGDIIRVSFLLPSSETYHWVVGVGDLILVPLKK